MKEFNQIVLQKGLFAWIKKYLDKFNLYQEKHFFFFFKKGIFNEASDSQTLSLSKKDPGCI